MLERDVIGNHAYPAHGLDLSPDFSDLWPGSRQLDPGHSPAGPYIGRTGAVRNFSLDRDMVCIQDHGVCGMWRRSGPIDLQTLLMLMASGSLVYSAWLTSIVFCSANHRLPLLIASATFPPVGIVHGIGVWFGGW
jgi:hypothetical protein